MTNIIVPLIISTNIFTNWTGLNYKGNEIGFKAMTIDESIVYAGKTSLVNRFSFEDDRVVLRTYKQRGLTNIYFESNIPGIIYTPNFK